MRLHRRDLRGHLERMGRAPVPPPSPDFAVRTEERLRVPGLALLEDEVAGARARRRSWAPALVAAAAVAALLVAAPGADQDVSVTADGTPASSTASPAPAPTLVAPTLVAPTTTTTAAPAAVPAPAAPRRAATTSTRPAPARPRPTTTVPGAVDGPATPASVPPPVHAVTTTTAGANVARVGLRCEVHWRESSPTVACTWAGAPDPAVAGWRVHRAAGDGAKRVVWTSADRSARAFVDRDVLPGTTYRYAVEGFADDRRVVARSGIVTVSCCPGEPPA